MIERIPDNNMTNTKKSSKKTSQPKINYNRIEWLNDFLTGKKKFQSIQSIIRKNDEKSRKKHSLSKPVQHELATYIQAGIGLIGWLLAHDKLCDWDSLAIVKDSLYDEYTTLVDLLLNPDPEHPEIENLDYDAVDKKRIKKLLLLSEEARNEFIKHNSRLVTLFVSRAIKFKGIGQGDMYMDIYNEGYCGMIMAVDRFNPAFNTTFSTFAMYWIYRHTNDVIDKRSQLIITPSSYNAIYKNIEYIKKALREENQTSRSFSNEEIYQWAQEHDVKLTMKQIENAEKYRVQTVFYDADVNSPRGSNNSGDDTSDTGTFVDFIEDPKNVEDIMRSESGLINFIADSYGNIDLSKLDEEEVIKEILENYYLDTDPSIVNNKTLKKIISK